MNKSQVKGHANEGKGKEVAGKVSRDESTKDKGTKKHGGKTDTVLGVVNDDPKKSKKNQPKSDHNEFINDTIEKPV